jgi:hypothetical protein
LAAVPFALHYSPESGHYPLMSTGGVQLFRSLIRYSITSSALGKVN